jgi:hypothetical protein
MPRSTDTGSALVKGRPYWFEAVHLEAIGLVDQDQSGRIRNCPRLVYFDLPRTSPNTRAGGQRMFAAVIIFGVATVAFALSRNVWLVALIAIWRSVSELFGVPVTSDARRR